METLTRDTAKSYLWNQVAVVLDGATAFAASVFIGRLAGPEAFGQFSWMLSAVALASLAAALGFKESIAVLAQRAGGETQALRTLLRRYLYIRSGAAIVAAAATAAALSRPAGVFAAAAAGIYLFVLLISTLLSAFDIALFKTRAVAMGRIVSCVVTLSLVAVGAVTGSMAVIFLGFSAGAFAAGLVYLAPLKGLLSPPASPIAVEGAFELPFALWLVGICNFLIGSQAGPLVLKLARFDAAAIAPFSAGLYLSMTANRAAMGGFANVMLASFSRAAAGPKGTLAAMHSLYIRVTALMSAPLLFAVIVFAPLLARLWLTGDVERAAGIARILAAWLLAGRLIGGGAHSTALYSAGFHRTGLAIRAAFAVISVAATYAAAVRYGATGAAAAAGAAGFLVVAAEWGALYRKARLALPAKALARIVGSCGAVALTAWGISFASAPSAKVLSGLVFVLGSAAALAAARPLEPGESARITSSAFVQSVLRVFERGAASGEAGGVADE